MYKVEELLNMKTFVHINNNWKLSRPIIPPFIIRLKDAWKVLIGKADAVIWDEPNDKTKSRQ